MLDKWLGQLGGRKDCEAWRAGRVGVECPTSGIGRPRSESISFPGLYHLLQVIQTELIFTQLYCLSAVAPPNLPQGLSQKSGGYPQLLLLKPHPALVLRINLKPQLGIQISVSCLLVPSSVSPLHSCTCISLIPDSLLLLVLTC